jgi:tRNA(Ile)-lysidine synthase TilS/MesJ
MYFGFLKRAAHRFAEETDDAELAACAECGAATIAVEDGEPRCAFCRTKALAHLRREYRVDAPSIRAGLQP